MAERDSGLAQLERWTPMLFVVGGVIVIGFAALEAVASFTDTSYPRVRNVLTIGYVLGFVGLVGLYPAFADRHPWLARAGAASGALGAAGFTLNVIVSLGQLAGLVAGGTPSWVLGVVVLTVSLGMLVGYLSFAIASYRTPEYSQTLAILLAVPGVIYAVIFVGTVTVGVDQLAFVLSTGEALGIIGVGLRLRTERENGGAPKTTGSPTM